MSDEARMMADEALYRIQNVETAIRDLQSNLISVRDSIGYFSDIIEQLGSDMVDLERKLNAGT